MINDAELAGAAHERAASLLRCWLAETHTPVAEGALRLSAGPLRIGTDVVHCSPTGQHGFGPIHVLDEAEEPVAAAEPALLATACSIEARRRALADAPINALGGSRLLEGVVRAAVAGPPDLGAAAPPWSAQVTDAQQARSALAEHVDRRVLPAARGAANPERATVELLTRGILPAIGDLGRRGVAAEHDLLAELAGRISAAAGAETDEATGALLRSWAREATLADLAVLNGSGLGEDGVLGVPHRVPNPLRAHAEPHRDVAAVPGVVLPELPDFALRPVRLGAGDGDPDVTAVHRWMNTEHVAVNWEQAWSWQEWRAELSTQLSGRHSVPCLVGRDGREFAYVEVYRVVRDRLAACYSFDDHDVGVHIAIGDPASTGRGIGAALLRQVAEGVLAADPRVRRVVAEPDVRNAASVAAFGKAGYVQLREVGLPTKNSALMVFERA
ncbi:GNAT family N-acetyltransferase [Salinifilum ghardaiensis]